MIRYTLLFFTVAIATVAIADHIFAQEEKIAPLPSIPIVEEVQPEPTVEKEKTNPELICLAMNLYHEARNQSIAGQLAVGFVTMNRVNDDRYPNTICEVVMQGPTRPSWKDKSKSFPVRHRCQFSWYCDGLNDTVKEMDTFSKLFELSEIIYANLMIDITDGATHYHADYVSPDWAATKTRTTKIDDHIFYRWEK